MLMLPRSRYVGVFNRPCFSVSATPKPGKRKVAITLGYSGTGYHGLQMSRFSPGRTVVPTVESVLEKALHAAGCISASNLGDLDRLAWSRMVSFTQQGQSFQLLAQSPHLDPRLFSQEPTKASMLYEQSCRVVSLSTSRVKRSSLEP